MKTEVDKAFEAIDKTTVSAKDAANHLGCTIQNVSKLVKSGSLEGRYIKLRVGKRSLDEYAKSRIVKVN